MRLSYKKSTVRALLIIAVTIIVIGAFACGFFAGKSGQRVETQLVWSDSEVICAEILDFNDGWFHVKGLDVNDINGRGEYTFTLGENTRLLWRGTEIALSDFHIGDRIAFFYSGLMLDSFPAQIPNVAKIKLLEDEL